MMAYAVQSGAWRATAAVMPAKMSRLTACAARVNKVIAVIK